MSDWDELDDEIEDDDAGLTQADINARNAARRKAEQKAKAKEQRQMQAELEELRKFKAELEAEKRAASTKDVFEQLGLPAPQVKYFMADNPELTEATPEAVSAWAREAGFEVQATEEEAEASKLQPFKPVSSSSSVPVGSTMTLAELQSAVRSNPGDERILKQLAEMVKSGRVH